MTYVTDSPTIINVTRKLSKSDWSTFCQKAYSELSSGTELDSSDHMADFPNKLYNIALTTIPKSKPHSRKHHTVWFNDDCKTAVKDRTKTLHKVKTSLTTENIEKYKIIRAKATRTIKWAKRRSWQTFVSNRTVATFRHEEELAPRSSSFKLF